MLDIARKPNVQPVPYRSWNLANLGDLFSEFDRLRREVGALMGQFGWVDSYPVDLYETADSVVLEMAVPGIGKDDLDISLEGNQLTIRGTSPEVPQEGERRYWVQTIPHGNFTRSVSLPTSVEADKVQAIVQNGLLRVIMPKSERARIRKIAVTTR